MEQNARSLLRERGQERLLAHYDGLSVDEQRALVASMEQANLFDCLQQLRSHQEWSRLISTTSGVAAVPEEELAVPKGSAINVPPARSRESLPLKHLRTAGEEALQARRIAALVVAGGGGQAT